jgi:hypothetical protein
MQTTNSKPMCKSAQHRQDILDGKRKLLKTVEELHEVADAENWTDHKREYLRKFLFPTPEEHEKEINAFYTIFDPYVPI